MIRTLVSAVNNTKSRWFRGWEGSNNRRIVVTMIIADGHGYNSMRPGDVGVDDGIFCHFIAQTWAVKNEQVKKLEDEIIEISTSYIGTMSERV